MKTVVSVFALFYISIFSLSAQVELGLKLGGSVYFGDLSSSVMQAYGQTDLAYGAYGRGAVSDVGFLSFYVQRSKIKGSDVNTANQSRNLSFQSNVLELGGTFEYYFLGTNRLVQPYLFAGMSVFNFNPKTYYNGQLVELQPLGTEGQGLPGYDEKYNLTRFALPFGIGAKMPIGQYLIVGVELSTRATFFDHLDDVSGNYVNYYTLRDGRDLAGSNGNGALAAALGNRKNEYLGVSDPLDEPSGGVRGNPARNDWFQSFSISVGYRLGSGFFGSQGAKSNSDRYNRCYSF